ncbi:MAG TPA: MTH1187 family thiamine-binding protein [Thermoplasmata archaeon]
MLAEFSISPIGVGPSVGEWVARCLDIVDGSGLPYRLGPMGTTVEGELDEVLDLIKQCHRAVLEDVDRVSTLIKIDDRKGVSDQLDAKVTDVERRLGRKLKT